MPKSKVNSAEENYSSSSSADRRTPVKLNSSGTPRWYIVLMLALMLLGPVSYTHLTLPTNREV